MSTHPAPPMLTLLPVDGLGEVVAGDDLAARLSTAVPLADGDVLVVTSKAVSKAEGRVRPGDRAGALAEETRRTVARRGATSIVRTHHGLVLAAAGVDASNTAPGTVVLLPRDPDESARQLRERLRVLTGRNVAVLVTDTAGRAWRHGQTDLAIGAAGMEVLHDLAGRTDPHGHDLAVTAPAVADELAGAADLVKGKLERRPAAVVRGLAGWVLPPGRHGPGAVALVRDEVEDMFGLGAREAVLAALHDREGTAFGSPGPAVELVRHLRELAGSAATVEPGSGTVRVRLTGGERQQGAAEVRLRAAAHAYGWRPVPAAADAPNLLRFAPGTP